MIFSGVKSLTIPEGKVKKITAGGVVLWEAKGFTNLLPNAVDTDLVTIYGGDYNGDGINDGYKTSTRLSSSSGNPTSSGIDMCASGFMPVTVGQTVRIKGSKPVKGVGSYLITYNGSKTKVKHQNFVQKNDNSDWSTVGVEFYTYANGILTIPITETNFGSGVAWFRTNAHFDENTIITVDEEIT